MLNGDVKKEPKLGFYRYLHLKISKNLNTPTIQAINSTLAEDSSLSSLKAKYLQIRAQSEKICAPLQAEDYVVQPIVDVSPPKWHLGHTTWFFEKMLLEPFCKNYKVFHAEYDYVFNSYYESIGKRVLRTNRGNLSRPSVSDVYKYRAHIDQQMSQYLTNQKLTSDEINILEIGLQHEQQHQELLLYDIKYILGTNPLFPAYQNKLTLTEATTTRPLGFLKVAAGNYKIGHQREGFSFDNEHGVHQVYLHDYQIADRLITNQEYLEFITDGGYENFRFWYSEAWEWVKNEQKKAPFHWHLIDGTWHHYTMNGLEPINPTEPVSHVSQFEASAFANWKGMRLPTEFEWEVACQTHQPDIPKSANFVEEGYYRPRVASEGNFQFYGDLWEWTNSAYLPYPYYKTAEGALGEYNGKFMINQMVLRGGSFATPLDHIRPTYRNFFHPHLNWHFTGIRLAKHD
ncbi:ergothioneine biosynthesis protein EgtB [Reichenbachiella agarivorans]|uniref:Ergothioneine biosynthesis protein EgtB n=1 Tax=Reichenbachiella agarivorans TaxID=2979464 RepID=A0ABY6CT54_9BACT|nr:ergothioneine biosynthesis protein EgtB [Reichenbachiella agarivorans]UXP32563.1 ergothioneine biosynthesis protein EgtB [Reichenbachiella agarivorans]